MRYSRRDNSLCEIVEATAQRVIQGLILSPHRLCRRRWKSHHNYRVTLSSVTIRPVAIATQQGDKQLARPISISLA
jgi:hypothetical protein